MGRSRSAPFHPLKKNLHDLSSPYSPPRKSAPTASSPPAGLQPRSASCHSSGCKWPNLDRRFRNDPVYFRVSSASAGLSRDHHLQALHRHSIGSPSSSAPANFTTADPGSGRESNSPSSSLFHVEPQKTHEKRKNLSRRNSC